MTTQTAATVCARAQEESGADPACGAYNQWQTVIETARGLA